MKHIYKTLLLNIIVCSPLLCAAQSGTHTEKLSLLSGMQTMEYRFMLFKTHRGDTLCAPIHDSCLTPAGMQYVWDSVGPPINLLPQYTNKLYKVTYTPSTDTTIYAQGQPRYNINIVKMEMVK